MIGYFLKDMGSEHFEICMHNISDDDIIKGKTIHAIFGCLDLKQRVVLMSKNIIDRMYVWYKYCVDQKLTSSLK